MRPLRQELLEPKERLPRKQAAGQQGAARLGRTGGSKPVRGVTRGQDATLYGLSFLLSEKGLPMHKARHGAPVKCMSAARGRGASGISAYGGRCLKP